jgi:transcriptional regulator
MIVSIMAAVMSKSRTDVVQGTLDMLILKSVALEPMHGFGVARRIEQVSGGVFRVNPGSLLVAFQRLERDGLVDAEWRTTENNRRARFYRLTAKGRRRLERDAREWARRSDAIALLMET